MKTKTQEVFDLVDGGETWKAVSIAKDFRRGMTREEKKAIEQAWAAHQNPDFYRQIGKNPCQLIQSGLSVFYSLFGECGKFRASK